MCIQIASLSDRFTVPNKPYPKVNDAKEIMAIRAKFRKLATAIMAIPVIGLGALAYYYM